MPIIPSGNHKINKAISDTAGGGSVVLTENRALEVLLKQVLGQAALINTYLESVVGGKLDVEPDYDYEVSL